MKIEIDLDIHQLAFVHALSSMIKFEDHSTQALFDSIMDQILEANEMRSAANDDEFEGFIDIDELENDNE